MREKLIAAGVRNLHEFGYKNCTAENIMTDDIYKLFFKSMLEENKGNGEAIDKEIDTLLSEIGE